jgi:hypothetical protein
LNSVGSEFVVLEETSVQELEKLSAYFMRQQEPSALINFNKIQNEITRRDEKSKRIARLRISVVGRIEVRTNELLDKISEELWKGTEAGPVDMPLAELYIELQGILRNDGPRFLHFSKAFLVKLRKFQTQAIEGRENPKFVRMIEDLSSILDLIPSLPSFGGSSTRSTSE